MKLLCFVALFVAVAAAQSGDDEPLETEVPERGGWPEHPQHPVHPSNTPWLSHRPSEKPGKGHPRGPNKGTVGPKRPQRQSSHEFNPDDAGAFRPQSLRRRGPPGGRRPGKHNKVFSPIFKVDNVTFESTATVQLKEGENMFFLMKEIRPPFKQYLKLTYNNTEPNQVSMEFGELIPPSRVFSSVFKVDNVTFQNTTSVQLKEGDNLFLKLKGRGPHHPHHFKPKRHGPQTEQQYLKLTYSSSKPNQVSVEYGVLKPINLGELFDEEDDPEDN